MTFCAGAKGRIRYRLFFKAHIRFSAIIYRLKDRCIQIEHNNEFVLTKITFSRCGLLRTVEITYSTVNSDNKVSGAVWEFFICSHILRFQRYTFESNHPCSGGYLAEFLTPSHAYMHIDRFKRFSRTRRLNLNLSRALKIKKKCNADCDISHESRQAVKLAGRNKRSAIKRRKGPLLNFRLPS